MLGRLHTLFAQVDRLESVIGSIPYTETPNHAMVQLKLSLLALIFVMAFLHFTWSLRQYGFLNVMIGACPFDDSGENENLNKYAEQMAVVQDQAAHAFNYGLRSYYFSIAALCWFFHPLTFILASLFVVYTLYNREFRSKAVRAITLGQQYLDQEFAIRHAKNKSPLKADSSISSK